MSKSLFPRYLYFGLISLLAFYIIMHHLLIVVSTGNIFSIAMLISSLIILSLWWWKSAYFNYVVMFWVVFIIVKHAVSLSTIILANAYNGFVEVTYDMIIYKSLITMMAFIVLSLAFKMESEN